MQSKPPVAGLVDGEDKHVHYPGAYRALLYKEFGGESCELF